MRELWLPWNGQPQEAVQINEEHWLAPDLLFVHSGKHGFWRGEPITPVVNTAALSNISGANNSPLNGTSGLVGNGTGYLEYNISLPTWYGYTFSVWCVGVSTTSTNSLIGIGSTDGNLKHVLRRSSSELAALSSQAASGASDANATGGYVSGNLLHYVGTVTSSTLRAAYTNGGNAGTSVTDRVPTGTPNKLSVLTDRYAAATTLNTASTSIRGVALPMLIGRVLTDEEIVRLYDEQRNDPWAIFEPRRIWVQGSAASGPPTLAAIAASNLTASGARLTVTV